LLTNLVVIEAGGLVIEVAFLIILVLLSVVVARMLIVLFKLLFGQSASFGSLVTPGHTARVLFTLGGDSPLFGGVVLRLVDNISV
jgi:hypothetical protein